jgi:hypothetical protein
VAHPQPLGLNFEEPLKLVDLLETPCPDPNVGQFLVSSSQYGLYVHLHV